MTRPLAALFPADVHVVEAARGMESEPLLPEEAACVAHVAEKRRREFTAGRACARRALAAVGVREFALVPDADRVPRWPEGIVGSISHSGDRCAAAVARVGRILGLGLDLEGAEPLEESLAVRICSEQELAGFAAAPRGEAAKAIFSAKESFYKCYFPLTGARLDFRDVAIELLPDGDHFLARLLRESAPAVCGVREMRGRLAWDAGYVATAVTLTAEATRAA